MGRTFGNRAVTAILRSLLHGLLGQDFALIELAGRRSGRAYTVPVDVFAAEDDYLIISRRERTWWRNLCDRPDAALRHRGSVRQMRAQAIADPREVAKILRLHLRPRSSHARFFGIAIGQDGEPNATQLNQAAQERVLIRLRPG